MKSHKILSTISAVLLLVVSSFTAHAQEVANSHLKVAREALRVTKASQRFDNILPAIADQIKQKMISDRPDLGEKITQVVNETAIELAPRRGDLENEIAAVYAKSFSEEELKQVADFFGSEAGAKFLKLSPILLREVENASKIWATGLGRDFSQQVEVKVRELSAGAAKTEEAPAEEAPKKVE